MTTISRWLATASAVAAAFMTAKLAKADEDTIRLGRMVLDDATVQQLDTRSGDDTTLTLVRGGGGGGGRGGGGGGGRGGAVGGARGGFAVAGARGGAVGGARGGFAVGYRGVGYGGYGRGYGGYGRGYGYGGYGGYGYGGYGWGGWGWGGGYWGGGYWPYYGYGDYYGGYPNYYNPYLYTPYYYYPTVNTVAVPVATYSTAPYSQRMMPLINDSNVLPAPAPVPNGGFNYDGGPAQPVPLPPQSDTPSTSAGDRFVSLPAATPKKFSYAAYGAKPASGTTTEQRLVVGK